MWDFFPKCKQKLLISLVSAPALPQRSNLVRLIGEWCAGWKGPRQYINNNKNTFLDFRRWKGELEKNNKSIKKVLLIIKKCLFDCCRDIEKEAKENNVKCRKGWFFREKLHSFLLLPFIYDDKYLWIKLQAGNALMKIIYRQNNICCAVACEDKL